MSAIKRLMESLTTEQKADVIFLCDDLEVITGNRVRSNCRFIKVTRKGFNILDLDTDRVIFKRHVYAKGMSNKEYAKQGPITGEFLIPEYVGIKVKPNTNQKVS